MRFDKIWVVAKKDMSEFRNNKYIMYSLILMPLLMALVLPIIYLTPFSLMATDTSNEPLDLNLPTSMPEIRDQTLSNATYSNTSFINCSLTNAVIIDCRLGHTTVNTSLVRNSYLTNSSALSTTVFHSNLENITTVDSTLQNSVIVGAENENQVFLMQFINFLMMFFILIPAIIPTVIASYSFVGEKLNRSLEPLLATPTTDAELLTGKVLSIFLPSVLVTWLAFIPFTIIVDVMTPRVLGYVPIPDLTWIIGVFLLAPMFCIMSIALNVIVSSRVTDVRASQQIGSLVVLPVVVVFIVALAGLFQLGPLTMLLITGCVALADVGISYLTLKTFRREEILIRWK